MNIFVSNSGINDSDKNLKEMFMSSGNVTSSKVISDKLTKHSQWFGFVEMTGNISEARPEADIIDGNFSSR